MKILSWLFLVVGVILCVIGIIGHSGAWPAAALCFFASTMVVLAQTRKK